MEAFSKNPEEFFTIYQPSIRKDTYKLVFEGKQPVYHKLISCNGLTPSFVNYKIPAWNFTTAELTKVEKIEGDKSLKTFAHGSSAIEGYTTKTLNLLRDVFRKIGRGLKWRK